jgi:hypothetical protein
LFGGQSNKIPVYLLLILLVVSYALGEEANAVPATLNIPDGTPVELRLAESVCSSHAHKGDRLDFVVIRDVNVGGYTIVPAGSIAHGSVTEVKGKRFLGIGGQVSLKLDSVELVNGDKVKLRASLNVKGDSHTKLMAAAMLVTGFVFLPAAPVFLLTRGRDSTVVKSTEITAYTAGPVSVLSAGLWHSQQHSSELDQMMDYLPARVFNAEGREGDMLNLLFVGDKEDLQSAFLRAGWVTTDKWKPVFVWHLMRRRTNDAQLPMARFYLFGRVQDYSYALPDPNAVMSRRHHLRIWKTNYTIDGRPIWAGAATHDVAIEIAKRGRIINHRIDPAVDAERDFIGADLTQTASVNHQQYVSSGDPVFQAQTASGEDYHSDSRILLLDLNQAAISKGGEKAPPTTISKAGSLPLAIPAAAFQGSPAARR